MGVVKGTDDFNYEVMLLSYSEDKFGQIPNDKIVKWAELTNNQVADLAGMNDGGDSFVKIAKYINEFY